MGHFIEVHDVKDLAFRQRIIDTLGENIYSSSPQEVKNEANVPSNGGVAPLDGLSPKPSAVGNIGKTKAGQKGMVEHIQGPMTEKEMLERNSAQAVLPWNPSSNLDDWYN